MVLLVVLLVLPSFQSQSNLAAIALSGFTVAVTVTMVLAGSEAVSFVAVTDTLSG